MLNWGLGSNATQFDVVTGDLNRLHLTGSLEMAITGCVADDHSDNELIDPTIPGQAAPRDAAIAASGNGCL